MDMENELVAARVVQLRERLAYEAAVALIESSSEREEGEWWNTAPGLEDELIAYHLEDALEYLELIGCLKFHPRHEDGVKVLPQPESEAADGRDR